MTDELKTVFFYSLVFRRHSRVVLRRVRRPRRPRRRRLHGLPPPRKDHRVLFLSGRSGKSIPLSYYTLNLKNEHDKLCAPIILGVFVSG